MRNLTGALSVDYDIDNQNAITFNTTHHPDNLSGPHNLCIFCHHSLEQFHRPDCACHMSGQTSQSVKWATEGTMPNELRPYMAQLMVNLQRVRKQQPPLTRDQFNQKYCEPTSQATPTPARLARIHQTQRGSTQQSYNTVPPPRANPPTSAATALPQTHQGWMQWYKTVPKVPSHHTAEPDPQNSPGEAIPHFHSYSMVPHTSPQQYQPTPPCTMDSAPPLTSDAPEHLERYLVFKAEATHRASYNTMTNEDVA
ncbi:hypothetical protein CYMTET_24583 [Cymbomonas tetramitiformis]|uniref:Uncharacterized protein n=1 Tax=Cymbomonas tetramitiformis TaxID=36881 RepID=A0AAE0KZT8_9CHLO|nr:hypothetical protein CYMTET_24583 [Cymbomonas tetramitiformis]